MPRRPITRLAAVAMAALTLSIGLVAVDATRSSSPAAAACSIRYALRLGSSGPPVRCLQEALNRRGYGAGPVDGSFGPMTRDALVRFQRARGLPASGIVTRRTARALGIWAGRCRAPKATPARARRLVVVTAFGTEADVDLLVKRGGRWRCRRDGMHGRVGRNGVRPLLARRSGDGTTPAGVFRLGAMRAPDGQRFQFFGNGSDPGVPGTWRQVQPRDCWGATPGTRRYNRLVRRAEWRCQSPDEYLPNITGAYSRVAIIGANLGPRRSGDQPGEPPYAAAIFLHRHSFAGELTKATSGCVSLGPIDLAFVLRRLVPGRTWFVIRSG